MFARRKIRKMKVNEVACRTRAIQMVYLIHARRIGRIYGEAAGRAAVRN